MTWEYKIVSLDTQGFVTTKFDVRGAERDLNRLGKDGWELVSVFGVNGVEGRTMASVMVFKRQVVGK